MLDKAKVAELEALLAQHAEPWEVAGQYVRTEYSGHGGFVVANCADAITGAADTAMFIAAMRTALPAMLRLARAVADAPREVCDWLKDTDSEYDTPTDAFVRSLLAGEAK